MDSDLPEKGLSGLKNHEVGFIASNWTQVWHGMTSAQINGWQAAQLIIDGD